MNSIYVIKSKSISSQLEAMLEVFTQDSDTIIIENLKDLPDLTGKKILFCVELNNLGYCPYILEALSILYERGKNSLLGSTGAIITHSPSELYTKSFSRYIIFLANALGCSFLGHPLVEATGSLQNFLTWQKVLDLSLKDICLEQCKKLKKRLKEDEEIKFENPYIIALHASSKLTSNTLMLWNMIKTNINGCRIEDFNVENGTIHDCIGCPYTTCSHYSKQNSCFYGGTMVSEIIPAIEHANAVVMICPNYNDAVSANITAVINRMTALYRKISFYNKYLFSVVVSGNSGSDAVAMQLIDALNINKGFRLPPYSAIMETANDPGTIKYIADIDKTSNMFAMNLTKSIKK